MAPRRVSGRFRIGLLIAGVTAGALLTATPRAGQQQPDRQAGAKPTAQGPGVPSIAVPRVQVPSVVVPGVTPAPGQAARFWMSAARAEAFVQAARLGVNYLPGEVLVKFKDGVGPAGQTRALQALGLQPTADSIEWAGQVAVVRDTTQSNAYILADQLKGQPEVEYAEPNFIARVDPMERASASAAPLPKVYVAEAGPGRRWDRQHADRHGLRGVPMALPAHQHARGVGHPGRRPQRPDRRGD